MINAKEALKKSIESSRVKVEQAIQNGIEKGLTCVNVDVAVSDEIAKELSENGYDVLVFSNPKWTKSTTIDFSESANGKLVITDDPVKAGRSVSF